MKVVHIADSDSGGGAAYATSRLHGALRRAGVDSQLFVRNSSAPGAARATIATRGDADELFPAVREAVVRQYVELNRTSMSNTHFSVHIDGADLSRVPLVAACDIVHLHWTASCQTPADIAALLNAKPVVCTLHDLEPLTGGCHFNAGCEGYVHDCARCPQLARDPFRVTETTLRDKTALWAGTRPTFIAPSHYMARCARRSAVARHAEASIVHIPHGIDVDAFAPRPKADARRALGLPPDGLYLLFGSNHNAEKRKGLDLVARVLAAVDGYSGLTVLTVGEPKLDLEDLAGVAVIQLGAASTDVMPTVYAAADVFLHLAVEDNFPLMLLESLSCGTPAIAFDIGGIADILHDEVCGRLVPAGDEQAMAAALSSLVCDRERLRRMGERARGHIEEHFPDTLSAGRHAALYAELLQTGTAPRIASAPPRETGLAEIFPRWSTACLVQELASARERASSLVEGSRAKSQRIAGLERDAAELARNLAEQSRQVQEKESELAAIHEVAEERKALAERLHASAGSIEAVAGNLQSALAERDDLLAKLRATVHEQHAEIELVHGVAAERQLLIDDVRRATSERIAALEREAAELRLNLADQSRQVQEKEAELAAIHEVAEERNALAQRLHVSAAAVETLAATLQSELQERDGMLATLRATVQEQHREIELVHRVAAERQVLIDDMHRVTSEQIATLEREAAELSRNVADKSRLVQEKEAELRAIHAAAEERKALAERLHAAAASLGAALEEQRVEMELIHRVAAERQALIEDLHQTALERAALIQRGAQEGFAPNRPVR